MRDSVIGSFSIHPAVNLSVLPDGYAGAHVTRLMPFRESWLLSKASCSMFTDCWQNGIKKVVWVVEQNHRKLSVYDRNMVCEVVSISLYTKEMLKQNPRWRNGDKVGCDSDGFAFILGPHGWIGIVYVGSCIARNHWTHQICLKWGHVHNVQTPFRCKAGHLNKIS